MRTKNDASRAGSGICVNYRKERKFEWRDWRHHARNHETINSMNLNQLRLMAYDLHFCVWTWLKPQWQLGAWLQFRDTFCWEALKFFMNVFSDRLLTCVFLDSMLMFGIVWCILAMHKKKHVLIYVIAIDRDGSRKLCCRFSKSWWCTGAKSSCFLAQLAFSVEGVYFIFCANHWWVGSWLDRDEAWRHSINTNAKSECANPHFGKKKVHSSGYCQFLWWTK